MANTYNTGNPVPSTSPKDLSDNASNFDEVLNSELPSFIDRLGRTRETLTGLKTEFDEDQAQRETLFNQLLNSLTDEDMGVYAAGIVLSRRNQVFQRAGIYYRAASTTVLPYTTTGDWGTESSKFVLAGDSLLRADLSSPSDPLKGITLIGGSQRVVASIAALRAYPKTGSTQILTADTGGMWALDPIDSTSVEDLNKGIVVAADGGRWKSVPGATRAQNGLPGTTFHDNGYKAGWWSGGASINGNGNKFNYFSMYIDNDQVVQQYGLNGATGSKVDGLNVTMLSGGPTTRGGRHAIDGVLVMQAATDSNNTDRNYVGVQGQVIVTQGDGGTGPLDSRGAAFGSSSYGALTGGQYFANLTAHEFNTSIEASLPGTRVAIHQGVQIASLIGQRGFNLDCGIGVSALGGSLYGYQYGICFHGLNGAPALSSDSTVIKVATTATSSGFVNILFDGSGVVFNQLIKTDQVNLRTGVLDLATAGAQVSLGSAAVAGASQIQGKTGAAGASWDSRVYFTGGTSTVGQGLAQVDAATFATSATSFRSTAPNATMLGAAGFPFSGAYLQTAPVITSDIRKKKDVKPISIGLDFVNSMVKSQGVIEYRLKDGGAATITQEIVSYDEVETPVLEEYFETETYIDSSDGIAVERTREVTRSRPVYDRIKVVDEQGADVMVEVRTPQGTEEYVDENGETKTRVSYSVKTEPKFYEKPRMQIEKVPVYAPVSNIGNGVRRHLGFSAQEIRKQLVSAGLEDCAAWCLEDPQNPGSGQLIRETQLISVLFKAVAELAEKVEALSGN